MCPPPLSKLIDSCYGGDNNTANATGNDSTALAYNSNNNTAAVNGNDGAAIALNGNYNIATVNGDGLPPAIAENGDSQTITQP